MSGKLVISAAALICMSISSVSFSTTASAAGCYYKAVKDGRVISGIRGVGHAAKKSWACNRARRECNRRLDRAFKSGQILPRGATSRNTRCKKSG